jgi:DNA mismatch endonuclease (patch repair protein)
MHKVYHNPGGEIDRDSDPGFCVADHVRRDKRSAIMRAVRRKNTRPELFVRKAAHRLGLRFRLQVVDLPGRPDLTFPKWRTVIFVNGCYWHRHDGCKHATTPKSNVAFWVNKFERNVRRDALNNALLSELGWKVVIIWQCEATSVDRAQSELSKHFWPAR